MRVLISVMFLAAFATACHSTTAADHDAPAAEVPEPMEDGQRCEDRSLTKRLARLHSFAIATDDIPDRQLRKMRAMLDGLHPAGPAEFGELYPGVARFSGTLALQTSDAIYHNPRFEGEEQPHILHWGHEALGRRADWSDSVRKLHLDDGVNLALWRETPDDDVKTLLVALREAGVRQVNAIGQQNVPSLTELQAPADADDLFRRLHGPDGDRLAARTFATHELERLVFGADGHSPEIDARMLEPKMSLQQRSDAYIEFLQREYHRAGCDIDPDHLVWLYRVRFLREQPLAVRTLSVDAEVDGETNWEEFVAQ